MTQKCGQKDILWAPWRMNYVSSIPRETSCFLCDYAGEPEKDRENLVLWRTRRCMVVMNRYPYNNGHMLIAPAEHIADLESADDELMLELTTLIRDIQKALNETISPHGFNVGINFGRCAGAGLPGHLHIHVVPRWKGDTNFMAVCSQTDVISQSLEELYGKLEETSKKLSLPAAR